MSQTGKSKNLALLIVTSNEQESQTQASRLRHQGHYVEVASGGFHAMNLLEDESNEFDATIIFGDQDDLPARELLSNIRSMGTREEYPVFILKEAEEKAEVFEAFEWGANDFGARELDFNNLHKRLKKMVSTARRPK